jgi:hypothetical protein
MLTRGQAARLLGRSVATVRRIEGRLLHPTRDARGTHWFHEYDVERLAARIRAGEVRLYEVVSSPGFAKLRSASSVLHTEQAVDVLEVARLRSEIERLTSDNRRLRDELTELRAATEDF